MTELSKARTTSIVNFDMADYLDFTVTVFDFDLALNLNSFSCDFCVLQSNLTRLRLSALDVVSQRCFVLSLSSSHAPVINSTIAAPTKKGDKSNKANPGPSTR
jgi:hypothetical protein